MSVSCQILNSGDEDQHHASCGPEMLPVLNVNIISVSVLFFSPPLSHVSHCLIWLAKSNISLWIIVNDTGTKLFDTSRSWKEYGEKSCNIWKINSLFCSIVCDFINIEWIFLTEWSLIWTLRFLEYVPRRSMLYCSIILNICGRCADDAASELSNNSDEEHGVEDVDHITTSPSGRTNPDTTSQEIATRLATMTSPSHPTEMEGERWCRGRKSPPHARHSA